MKPLSVIVVGVGKWESYTLPFLQGMKLHDPESHIVCVDNGMTYPDFSGVTMVKVDPVTSYAAAINLGIMAASPSQWFMVCNNDVLVHKPFAKNIDKLVTKTMYGFCEYTGVVAEGVRYLSGWCMLISHKLIGTIGLFDENFAPMWFEDADYSYRATQAGFPLAVLDRNEWGLQHLEDERMTERKGYMHAHMDARQKNRQYFQVKHGIH